MPKIKTKKTKNKKVRPTDRQTDRRKRKKEGKEKRTKWRKAFAGVSGAYGGKNECTSVGAQCLNKRSIDNVTAVAIIPKISHRQDSPFPVVIIQDGRVLFLL